MKIENLKQHCDNCSDNLYSLCERFTPYDNYGLTPICNWNEFKGLDIDKKNDVEKIEKHFTDNKYEEYEEEEEPEQDQELEKD